MKPLNFGSENTDGKWKNNLVSLNTSLASYINVQLYSFLFDVMFRMPIFFYRVICVLGFGTNIEIRVENIKEIFLEEES